MNGRREGSDAEESAAGVPDPFGLRESGQMIRAAASLLRQAWLPLLAIAAASLLASELLAKLAVIAGGAGAVPGFLALALVPLSGLVALVGMLLVMRRRQEDRTDPWVVIAAAGSVLVPYLVVYESRGLLRADLIAYVNAGIWEDIAADQEFSRMPQIGSWLVLGIVVVALLVRIVGGRLTDRFADRRDARRGALQVIVGYAEAVWVTLGAWVLAGALANIGGWWAARAVAQGIFGGWARVRESLPSMGALGDWVTGAVPVLTDALVTGLVVPLSMLTIAVIVYGLQVTDTVSADDVVGAATRGRFGRLTQRVGDARLRQAWSRLSDTSGRFGALVGGAALVLRSAFAPALVYCVIFTLVQQLHVLLWWLARLVLGHRDELTWEAWYNPLEGVSQMLVLVLTAVLTAVFADRLLTRFGAEGQLRRRRSAHAGGSGSSTKVAGGKPREVTRTETGSASTGSSTSTD